MCHVHQGNSLTAVYMHLLGTESWRSDQHGDTMTTPERRAAHVTAPLVALLLTRTDEWMMEQKGVNGSFVPQWFPWSRLPANKIRTNMCWCLCCYCYRAGWMFECYCLGFGFEWHPQGDLTLEFERTRCSSGWNVTLETPRGMEAGKRRAQLGAIERCAND